MTLVNDKSVWTWCKFVIGIISILLFFIICFQSFVVLIDNALSPNKDVSGMVGFLVALFILTAGIVGIVNKNSKAVGGTIACISLYWLGAIVSFLGTSTFITLRIWGGISFLFGLFLLFRFINGKK